MGDHGNADHMLYDNGEIDPSHGINPVLLTLITKDEQLKKARLLMIDCVKQTIKNGLGLLGIETLEKM